MERHSILKQIGTGACLGILFGLIARLNAENPDPLVSAATFLQLVGGAIAGAVIYMAFYRFWPTQK